MFCLTGVIYTTDPITNDWRSMLSDWDSDLVETVGSVIHKVGVAILGPGSISWKLVLDDNFCVSIMLCYSR